MYERFKDNTWAANLIGSLSSFNCGIKYFIMCDRCFHQTYFGQTFER